MAERNQDRAEGFGYVGRWNDGTLGWSMPRHMDASTGSESWQRRGAKSCPNDADWASGERHYLCRITVELVRDKLGRPIVHIPKRKEASDGS